MRSLQSALCIPIFTQTFRTLALEIPEYVYQAVQHALYDSYMHI